MDREVLFLVLILIMNAETYNVDLFGSPSTFKGPDGSYLGISMHVHRITGYAWLMSGAPRADSIHQPDLSRPGAIYMCSLDIVQQIQRGMTDLSCTQVPLDRTGNTDPNEHKDSQWLGVSVHSHTIVGTHDIMVACGHLWRYDHLIGGYYETDAVNGVCYVRRGHPSTGGITRTVKQNTYYQILNYKNNTRNIRGQGAGRLSGMSSHVAGDGRVFIGTPGVGRTVGKTGNGGISMYDPFQDVSCDLSDVSYPADPLRYLGFSLTTANVLRGTKFGYNLISGAPTWRLVGQVLIYEVRGCTAITLAVLNGTQLGSYFGASLLAADVNGDGWDDLFVGAPLYTTRTGDEGVVYVYYGSEQELIEGPTLSSGAAFGRFGTTLANAADLDEDGYDDIIIGAPYENDNQGAVYVYSGSAGGISVNYTQKIVASDLPGQPRGLGYGITGGFDVDRSGYKDIAIGAYDTGHLYVLRSRPVLNIYVDTELTSPCITPGEQLCENRGGNLVPCFKFNLTLRWNSMRREALALTHAINWAVEMDRYEVDKHRAFFITDDRSIRRQQGNVTLLYTDLPQINFQMQVPRSPVDQIVPVKLKIYYSLDHPNITHKENRNGLAPIVNHTLDGTMETEIQFCKDCSGNLTCETDLSILLTSEQPRYVIGQSEGFKLRIEVTNDGDGAYNAQLELRFPRGVEIQSISTSFGQQACFERVDEESDTNILACPLGNPIPANTTRMLYLSVKSPQRQPTNSLTFDTSVRTTSTETPGQLLNNNASLVVPVHHDARLEAKGSSSPPSLVAIQVAELANLTRSPQTVKHIVDIRNKGPGLVTNFTVDMKIPDVHRKDIIVAAHDFEISYDARREMDFSGCVASGGGNTDADSGVDYTSELNKIFGQTGKIVLDPEDVPFLQVQCAIDKIKPGEGVIITYTVAFLVSKKTEGVFSGRTEFDIVSRIKLPKYIGEKDCGLCQTVEITTMIEPPASDGLVPWWAILASALGGLLLFIILIVVLAKLGFFRRQKRDQLSNQRAKSMLLQSPEEEEDDSPSATLQHRNPQTPEEEKAVMQSYVKSALHD